MRGKQNVGCLHRFLWKKVNLMRLKCKNIRHIDFQSCWARKWERRRAGVGERIIIKMSFRLLILPPSTSHIQFSSDIWFIKHSCSKIRSTLYVAFSLSFPFPSLHPRLHQFPWLSVQYVLIKILRIIDSSKCVPARLVSWKLVKLKFSLRVWNFYFQFTTFMRLIFVHIQTKRLRAK